MLHKNFRLPASVRFLRSQIEQTPFFSMKVIKNDLSNSRFGFLVSKRVDKRAVIRNRVKRQIRSGVEALLPKIMPGYDILFVIKQASVGQTTDVLQKSVQESFVKKGLVTTRNEL